MTRGTRRKRPNVRPAALAFEAVVASATGPPTRAAFPRLRCTRRAPMRPMSAGGHIVDRRRSRPDASPFGAHRRRFDLPLMPMHPRRALISCLSRVQMVKRRTLQARSASIALRTRRPAASTLATATASVRSLIFLRVVHPFSEKAKGRRPWFRCKRSPPGRNGACLPGN